MTFHPVFDSHNYFPNSNISEFFFNAVKITCFMIIEGKYPNSFYNNFLIPLAVDNISLHQNIAKILLGLFCVVADLFFKTPICDERSAPFAVHCPPLDQKKIDKTGWGIADSLKRQEKNRFP